MKNKNFISSRQNFNSNGSKTYFKNNKLKNILSWLLIAILCFTVIGSVLGTVAFGRTQTAHADVVVEDNKYYYTGSNFYVPLTYGDTVNMVNFECDLYPYERSILIGDESLRRNLIMPVFSAFSDVKTLPYAVEYGGETYLPDNDGSLSFSNYDRYVNYDSNNLPVDVTSLSQLTDNTYAEKIVYLVDNQSGNNPTPISLSEISRIPAGTYVFKETISYFSWAEEYGYEELYFSSNGTSYESMGDYDGDYDRFEYAIKDTSTRTSFAYDFDTNTWYNEAYRTIHLETTQVVNGEFYEWFTANVVSFDAPDLTYTVPKGYYIVNANPTLPTERLDIIFQLQDGQAIESIFTGNNDSLAYTPYNNDSYIVYNSTTGWTNLYKRIWILANDIILNESAYQWFTENVSLYQPVERNTIKFATQFGFNSNVVSVQFTHDIGLSFDSAIVIENKVIYTAANGFKYIITFYSNFDSSTVNLLNRYAFENRTYYLENALYGDGNYQLGYDNGYNDGIDSALEDFIYTDAFEYEARFAFYDRFIAEYKSSAEFRNEIANAKWAGALEERENENNYNFVTVLSAMYNAPLGAFRDFLSFELLGVDMLGFFTGLFTIAFVLFVIRKLT